MKITGLDALTKDFDQVQRIMETLEGEIAEVRLDPIDPASIEHAINTIESIIDEKISGFSLHPMAASILERLKDTYRQYVLDKAAEARAAGDGA